MTHVEKLEQLVEIPLVHKAFVYAAAAHAAVGQKRKYSGEPYIVHPVEVCSRVSEIDHTKEMLAAALLHDVVEDTEVSIEEIERMFGITVANLVSWLTDISKPGDGNRAMRKAMDRAHTQAAPFAAQTIKLADLIANTRDITEADKSFAKVYMAEKRAMLEGMKGDKILMAEAWSLVEAWEEDK